MAIPIAEHKLVDEAHQHNCLEIPLCVLRQQFRSGLSKQVISNSFRKRFCNIYWVTESENRFITPRNMFLLMFQRTLISWKMCLDSVYPDVKTLRQVLLCRKTSDLEMNWIVPLLLAPVDTAVRPAEHEFVRRRSLLLVALQCFLPGLRLKTKTTACRTKL